MNGALVLPNASVIAISSARRIGKAVLRWVADDVFEEGVEVIEGGSSSTMRLGPRLDSCGQLAIELIDDITAYVRLTGGIVASNGRLVKWRSANEEELARTGIVEVCDKIEVRVEDGALRISICTAERKIVDADADGEDRVVSVPRNLAIVAGREHGLKQLSDLLFESFYRRIRSWNDGIVDCSTAPSEVVVQDQRVVVGCRQPFHIIFSQRPGLRPKSRMACGISGSRQRSVDIERKAILGVGVSKVEEVEGVTCPAAANWRSIYHRLADCQKTGKPKRDHD